MGDPEHRVAMFQLAQERKRAGLPQWAGKVRLRDVWHNEEMTFEEIRDAVVQRVRASKWFTKKVADDEFDELVMLVEELADTPNAEEFDHVWGEIDYLADYDRIWLETR